MYLLPGGKWTVPLKIKKISGASPSMWMSVLNKKAFPSQQVGEQPYKGWLSDHMEVHTEFQVSLPFTIRKTDNQRTQNI